MFDITCHDCGWSGRVDERTDVARNVAPGLYYCATCFNKKSPEWKLEHGFDQEGRRIQDEGKFRDTGDDPVGCSCSYGPGD